MKIKYGTGKLIICLAILLTLVIGLAACLYTPKTDTNPLVGKYYSGTYHIEGQGYGFVVCTLRFYEDNTLQIVDNGMGRDIDKRTSYYATYTTDGNALFIRFGSKETSGVILENGSEIRIGTDKFRESNPEDLSKATLAEFK